MITARNASAAVLALFGISGAIGLAYQVLWSRYLLDFVGVGAYSQATVLAAFMGGLALGNALLSRFADRLKRPLLLFALLEGAIGVYGFAYPHLQALVAEVYLGAGGGAEAIARALSAGLLLLPPTVLMGGTYPAVLRHLTRELPETGRRASEAYAVNALGAAAGALATAFVLVPLLGMRASLYASASLNLVIALAAAALAERRSVSIQSDVDTPEARGAEADARAPGGWGWSLVLLAAGFVTFTLEMAWTRYLSLLLGSSTQSFAVMLAAFIAGIGLGSALLSRVEHRLRDPLRALGWAQLTAGIVLLLPLPLFQYFPWAIGHLVGFFAPNLGGWVLFSAARLALCLLLMLPATLALGVSLPLVIKGLARSLGDLGALAGRCYAANTVGNVAGAVLTGLFLLPAAGVEGTFRIAALSAGLLGFGIIFSRLPSGRARRQRALVWSVAPVVAIVLLQALLPRWNGAWFVFSPFRRLADPPSLAEARSFVGVTSVLLFEDDPAGHLLVFDFDDPGGWGRGRSLMVGGKAEASSTDDMPTQRLVAHIPLVLRPGARDVLVVGLASGSTAGSVLTHPVNRLDIVEIIGSMPRAAAYFDTWNGRPLQDPRTRLLHADARAYLRRPGSRYDVIVSEPSNPWMAGVASLFTAEFYAAAAERLHSDGLLAQWIQLYELDDASFLSAMASFQSVFPETAIFRVSSGDLLVVGSRQPWEPNWEASLERLARPAVRRDLSAIGVADLPSLLAQQVLSPPGTELMLENHPPLNTDDNRRLEAHAPVALFAGASVDAIDRLDERLTASPALLLSRLAEDRREQIRIESLLGLASGRSDLAGGPLGEAFATVLMETQPEWASQPLIAGLIPLSLRVDLPPSFEEIRDAIERESADGRIVVAEGIVQRFAVSILNLVALEESQAEAWIAAGRRWASRSPGLRSFHVQLLMAARARREAAQELLAWAREPSVPPLQWSERNACLTEVDDLCDRVRRLYRSRQSSAGGEAPRVAPP